VTYSLAHVTTEKNIKEEIKTKMPSPVWVQILREGSPGRTMAEKFCETGEF